VSELLIVVDMQNGFLREGNLASDRCLAVLPAVQEEVNAALAAGRRVLFTADTHEVGDAEFAVFPEHCIRGSREAELVDELRPLLAREDVLLVRKRRYSALFQSEMEGSPAPLRDRLGADLWGMHRHLRPAHHCGSAQPGLAGDRGSSRHRHL
jgi:nicotinamidase-related amidase